jgi:hypothetical protein
MYLVFVFFLFKWNARFNLILITCTVDEVRICLLIVYEYLQLRVSTSLLDGVPNYMFIMCKNLYLLSSFDSENIY